MSDEDMRDQLLIAVGKRVYEEKATLLAMQNTSYKGRMSSVWQSDLALLNRLIKGNQ